MAEQQRVPAGIRFQEAGKIYYFDARGYDIIPGSYVVVETSHGQEVGRVVVAPDQVIVSEIRESLKPILRLAEPADLERASDLKKRAKEQVIAARREAVAQGVQMHVAAAAYSLDGSQLTFYFTADDRVDFRGLSRAVSEELGVRAQFLQIGDRDRAKIMDGIGRCGERLCCSSWLTTFPTVSIRHAKEQDLPLNPSKLSGACGRLLCCLTYEYDQYREIKGGLPKVGARISTPTGDAKVVKINILKETISLVMGEPVQLVEMPIDQFRLMYGTAIRPKELTETLDKQLFAQEAAQTTAVPPPERPPQAAIQEVARPEGTAADRPRRRRRRRRRRGGGGPPPSP
jgi:cell fate regulator YaaT (PSP1 superfamily)